MTLKTINYLRKKSVHDSISSKPSNHFYCLGIALLFMGRCYDPDYSFDAYANEFINDAVKSLKLKSVNNKLFRFRK